MRRATIATIGTVLAGLAAATPAAANQPPVMQYDFYKVASTKASLLVRAPGVLANDSDPDGDPLTAALVSGPASGTLVLQDTGRFRYTPQPGFSGLDQWSYAARDKPDDVFGCCGNVYIYVTRPPVAHDDSYVAISGIRRQIPDPGVMANDEGADSVRVADPPDHGYLNLRRTGRFNYIPDPGFVGTDTFTYDAVVDGEPPSRATAAIKVKASNQPPAPVADAYSTPEDSSLFIGAPGVLANDHDPDGDELTAELVSPPFGLSFNLYPDGSFDYDPPPEYDSPVSFTYRVSDGLETSAPVTVEIEIPFVNDPPFGEDDYYELFGARSIRVPAPGVLANDGDPVEGDGVRAKLVQGPAAGELRFHTDGSFFYRKPFGAGGADGFTYRVIDSGGAQGNIAFVNLNLDP